MDALEKLIKATPTPARPMRASLRRCIINARCGQCRLALLPSRALRVQIALEFSKLPEILGRDKPTVIT